MTAPPPTLWKLWKAGPATFPQLPQGRRRLRKVLPMSLDYCVTYVPGTFTVAWLTLSGAYWLQEA